MLRTRWAIQSYIPSRAGSDASSWRLWERWDTGFVGRACAIAGCSVSLRERRVSRICPLLSLFASNNFLLKYATYYFQTKAEIFRSSLGRPRFSLFIKTSRKRVSKSARQRGRSWSNSTEIQFPGLMCISKKLACTYSSLITLARFSFARYLSYFLSIFSPSHHLVLVW